MTSDSIAITETDSHERHSLGKVLVPLMKGVVYRDADPARWDNLLRFQSRVIDHVSVLGLTLIVHEAEGYAFLRSRADPDSGDEGSEEFPRLVTRRPLSFPVSLLLVLLRKRLVEFDAAGGETRLVLTHSDIVDLLRLFLPDSSNEAKLIDKVDTHIRKVVELGFMRKLKSGSGEQEARYEVRRIIRSFVDAQWLSEFDERLAAYAQSLNAELPSGNTRSRNAV